MKVAIHFKSNAAQIFACENELLKTEKKAEIIIENRKKKAELIYIAAVSNLMTLLIHTYSNT